MHTLEYPSVLTAALVKAISLAPDIAASWNSESKCANLGSSILLVID